MSVTPEKLLHSSDCLLQSLSVSNDHAVILLRTTESNKVIRSLLKLSVLPTHIQSLAPSSDVAGLEPKYLGAAFSPQESSRILDFLSRFSFELNSESGAEYSYYDAFPKSGWQGFLQQLVDLATDQPLPAFRAELISPASDKQIQCAMPVPAQVMITETAELYQQVVLPYIQSVVESGSLSWIDNVISGKKEVERLLLDTDDYILNVDTKWRSHPDPKTVPREEWKNDTKAVQDLYCLAIVKESGVASLRDLRARHIPMLRDILMQCPMTLEDVYGIHSDQLRIFIHYHPQFYHLHVHFTRLENEIGCQVERGHLISDIIQNLELDDEFYCTRTINYKLRTNHKLNMLIQESQ
jgi:m7GpppX diphosphatase